MDHITFYQAKLDEETKDTWPTYHRGIMPYHSSSGFKELVQDSIANGTRLHEFLCRVKDDDYYNQEIYMHVLVINLLYYVLDLKTGKIHGQVFSRGLKNISEWFGPTSWEALIRQINSCFHEDDKAMLRFPELHSFAEVIEDYDDDDDYDTSSLAPINRPRESFTDRPALNDIINPETPRESFTDRPALNDIINPETPRESFTDRPALNDIINPETPRESFTDRPALTETTNNTDFSKMLVKQLKEECKRRGLRRGGLKQDLIDRLEDYQRQNIQRANTPVNESGTTNYQSPRPGTSKTQTQNDEALLRSSVKLDKNRVFSYDGKVSSVMKAKKMDIDAQGKDKEMDHQEAAKKRNFEEEMKRMEYDEAEKQRKHIAEEAEKQRAHDLERLKLEKEIAMANANSVNQSVPQPTVQSTTQVLSSTHHHHNHHGGMPPYSQHGHRHQQPSGLLGGTYHHHNHHGGMPPYSQYGHRHQQPSGLLGGHANPPPLLEQDATQHEYVKITQFSTDGGWPTSRAFHASRDIPDCTVGKWYKSSNSFVCCTCNHQARLKMKSLGGGKFDIEYDKANPHLCQHVDGQLVYPPSMDTHG